MYMFLVCHIACLLSIRAVTALPASTNDETSCSASDAADMLTRYSASSASNEWHDWSHVKDLIVFGASYAYTSRFSDPTKHSLYYGTSCDGLNYIDQLNLKYNQSVIRTTMHAFPGATAETSLGEQVAAFANAQSTHTNWSAQSSLFHLEFGINDINLSGANYAADKVQIFQNYKSSIEQLYTLGARNFLIINTPPIDVSPQATVSGPGVAALWAASVADYNTELTAMIHALTAAHTDTTFFHFDLHALFQQVLADPTVSPQTSVYEPDVLHDICGVYATKWMDLPGEDYWDRGSGGCEWPVYRYFWLSGYHPTWPLHDLMAERIAEGLEVS